MGVLSKIKNAAVKAVYKVADPVITAIGAPVKTVKAILDPKKTVKEVSNEFFAQPKSTQAIKATTNIIAIGGGALAGAAGKLGTIAKAIIPTSIKGKAIAAVTVPVAAGIIVSSPKAREEIVSAPSALVNVGTNIGDFIESPTLQNAKDIVMENPLAAGIIGGGALLATVPLVAPAIGNIITGEKLDDIEDAITANPTYQILPMPSTVPTPATLPTTTEAIPAVNNTIPVLSSGKKTTKRRKAKPKVQPSIRITNRLMNRNINKVIVHR